MTDPFIKAKPGAPLLSTHWNEMQTRLREEIAQQIQTHDHSGNDKGTQLKGAALVPNVELQGLKVKGNSPIELGAGETKDVNAGKIGYRINGGGGLEIYGAGAKANELKLSFHAAGGSTHNGPLTVTGALEAGEAITAKKSLTVEKDLEAKGTLKVIGKFDATSTLTVVGALEAKSSLTVTGTLKADGALEVKGALNANDALEVKGALNANGALTVAGTLTAKSSLTVTGTLNANGALTVARDLTANGALEVIGALTAKSSVKVEDKLEVTGSLTVGGDFSINSSLTIGGKLTVGSLAINDTFTVANLSFGHEAIRIIRGYVTNGGMAATGAGYRSSRLKKTDGSSEIGVFTIQFVPPFNASPVVVATQIFPGSNGFNADTRDNAIVLTCGPSECIIKVGDNMGKAADRDVCFVAIG